MDILIYSIVFLPMAAALISYLAGRRSKDGRNIFADIITGVTFILCAFLCVQMLSGGTQGTIFTIPYVCGMGMHFTLDGFRALYGTIAAFMWFMTTLFSREYFGHYRNRNRYYLFLLLTLGATEGVFFSADFYTTFIFFEIMSLASYVWVVHDEKPEAQKVPVSVQLEKLKPVMEEIAAEKGVSLEDVFILYMDLQSEASCATNEKLKDSLQDINNGFDGGSPLLFR